jgi:hypothetical protein
MSSKFSKPVLMPASAGRKVQAMAPKGDHDALPTSQGWYATPATTGHDDDLSSWRDAPPASEGWYDDPSMLQGREDALPASMGWYDRPSMPQGREDALPATKAKSEKKLKPESFNSLSNSREAKPPDAIPANASSINRSTRLARI